MSTLIETGELFTAGKFGIYLEVKYFESLIEAVSDEMLLRAVTAKKELIGALTGCLIHAHSVCSYNSALSILDLLSMTSKMKEILLMLFYKFTILLCLFTKITATSTLSITF